MRASLRLLLYMLRIPSAEVISVLWLKLQHNTGLSEIKAGVSGATWLCVYKKVIWNRSLHELGSKASVSLFLWLFYIFILFVWDIQTSFQMQDLIRHNCLFYSKLGFSFPFFSFFFSPFLFLKGPRAYGMGMYIQSNIFIYAPQDNLKK